MSATERESDPIALDAAVSLSLRQLLTAVQAAARAKGETPRALVVLWTSHDEDTIFDGGVAMLGPDCDDQDFEIMGEFLDGAACGDRVGEALPQMGALN